MLQLPNIGRANLRVIANLHYEPQFRHQLQKPLTVPRFSILSRHAPETAVKTFRRSRLVRQRHIQDCSVHFSSL